MLHTRIKAAREQGFTLIELLIVIVVLGLLAGIVVLGVTKFTTDAKDATCKATKDNLQIAADAYQAQNNGTAAGALSDLTSYLKAGQTVPTGVSLVSGVVTGTCA